MPVNRDIASLNTPQHNSATLSSAATTTTGRAAPVRRIVVVGAPSDIPRALAHPAVSAEPDAAAVLAIDVESPEGQIEMARLAGMLRSPAKAAILVAGPIGTSTMRQIADLALLHRCEVLAVMPTETLPGFQPVVVWSGGSPLVQLAGIPHRGVQAFAKRAFDIVVSIVGLIATAPLLALLAALVRLESPGAPIFRHERIGRDGKRFACLKLRTMRSDAESFLRADPELYEEYRRNHFKISEDRDPRITRLGRFLRKTSLDELPQLWNVLVGDMSLVGPRPVIEEELGVYGGSQPLLLSMRPGLTGAWAVSGRHQVGYPARCEVELRYVREWNLVRDAHILLRTVKAVAEPLIRS